MGGGVGGGKEERVGGGGAVVCTLGENMLINLEALFKTKPSELLASSWPN